MATVTRYTAQYNNGTWILTAHWSDGRDQHFERGFIVAQMARAAAKDHHKDCGDGAFYFTAIYADGTKQSM